jgi:hypothetical protein
VENCCLAGHPGIATDAAKAFALDAPQGNIELMTKIEILDFKPAPRLEQVGDKRRKQMEDRKHRIR